MPDCLFDNRNISRQDRFPFKKTVLFHPYPGKIKNIAERQKNQEQRRKTEKSRTTHKDRKIKNNAERQNWLQLVRRPSDYEPSDITEFVPCIW